MSTPEEIQQRAKEAAAFYQTLLMCGNAASLESVIADYLTTQQAEHAKEVEKLTKERDAARTELDALKAERDALLKDKEMLDALAHMSLISIVGPNGETRYSADFGEQNWTSHLTPREAITAVMQKGDK